MNQRLKQLSAAARHWAHYDGIAQHPESSPDILFEEKFAELIIKECAFKCEQFGESGDGYTCSSEIQKYFGV